MAFSESDLAFFGGSAELDPAEGTFSWPPVDEAMIRCAVDQIKETISIYDRSSVFLSFEEEFSAFHETKHSVLFNSGTSALHAAYDGFSLRPGDEIICGGYNFHASMSPALQYGITPVFGDVDFHGNLTAAAVMDAVTDRTKGVVVTHMWGNPCSHIGEIATLCREHGLFLLEDCSHAHGATYADRLVGTFGDVAAWSLQGEKVISGGEGGILSTDRSDLYHNALLFGHYNKRPKREIPCNHRWKDYFTTGKGLKLRAHPVAIAIALQQFRNIGDILSTKGHHAQLFEEALAGYDFVSFHRDLNSRPSWYAFVFAFDERQARISRSQFVDLLLAEGLVEFDIPGSTGDITCHRLFQEPQQLFPHLDWSTFKRPRARLPGIEKMSKTVIKLPVWGRVEDTNLVQRYCRGFKKVAEVVKHSRDLSTRVQERQESCRM